MTFKIKKRCAAITVIIALLCSACGEKEYAFYDLGGSSQEQEGLGDIFQNPNGSAGSNTGTTGSQATEGSDDDETGSGFSGDSIFGRLPGNSGENGTDGSNGAESGGFVVNEGPNTAYQLTEADIQAMNDNQAVIIRSNHGYVSTLVGRYYDQRITVTPGSIRTFEEAINSLNGIATLLGFQAGTEFFADTGAQDKEGYTYLTYRQKYAGNVVENATLHIVLDPQGYTAAVSCSFVPGLGISEGGAAISAEQAMEAARQFMEQSGYTSNFYPEFTTKAAVPFEIRIINAWVVVCDNPASEPGFEYMPYLKIYISMDGEFLMAMTASTPNVMADTNYYPTESYFAGYQKAEYKGTVNFKNTGSTQVNIPVAYNPNDGLYYMIDLDRKIAIADYNMFMNQGYQLEFLTSVDNTWDERDLAAMYNYEAAYDAYAAIGLKSPDGFESPILALRHWEENGQPVNNAVFISYLFGWYVFGYSEANDYCYDLDAIGHEYTHAVTLSTIQGSNYQNDAGAVNEAYSDVMGNLIEIMAGRTGDSTWQIAENSNETLRSMSSPYEHAQPYAIGDLFYVPNTSVPNAMLNDLGGVHTNSSIVNYVAYWLNQQGMDFATEFDLFYTSMQLLTPANTFQDVYAALIFSARSNGYAKYEGIIQTIFSQNGVLAKDRLTQETSYMVNGCGRIQFQVNTRIEQTYGCRLILWDTVTGNGMVTWPNDSGVVSMLAPAGTYYYIQFDVADVNTGNMGSIYVGANGWTNQMNYAAAVALTEGQTLTLPDIN